MCEKDSKIWDSDAVQNAEKSTGVDRRNLLWRCCNKIGSHRKNKAKLPISKGTKVKRDRPKSDDDL